MSKSSAEKFPLHALMLVDPKHDLEKMRDTQRRDEHIFHLLLILSFPLFFLLILAERLIPGTAANAGSVFSQARAAASSTIAIVLSS